MLDNVPTEVIIVFDSEKAAKRYLDKVMKPSMANDYYIGDTRHRVCQAQCFIDSSEPKPTIRLRGVCQIRFEVEALKSILHYLINADKKSAILCINIHMNAATTQYERFNVAWRKAEPNTFRTAAIPEMLIKGMELVLNKIPSYISGLDPLPSYIKEAFINPDVARIKYWHLPKEVPFNA